MRRLDLPVPLTAVLDPIITPRLWAESVEVVVLGDGRRVLVRVTSDNLD